MATLTLGLTVLLSVALSTNADGIDYADLYHPRISSPPLMPAPPQVLEETGSAFWIDKAQKTLKNKVAQPTNVNTAKNAILFLGDGMSIPTLTAARMFQEELKGDYFGEGGSLSFEKFPYSGFSKTYCVDVKIADSACSCTAYLCGVKGNEGTVGVNGKVQRGDCAAMMNPENHVDSIAKWFQDKGKATGIVTTTRVTHASPSGTYAHTAERFWEDDSYVHGDGQDASKCDDNAEQLMYKYPGRNFNVIFGGGRRGFLPENNTGNRLDQVDMIDYWKKEKASQGQTYAYLTTRDELMSMSPTPSYSLGLFGMDNLDYHSKNNPDQPTLAEMTQKAIEVLQSTGKGFFLFVEGGRIDHGHHETKAHIAIDETIEMAKAVEVAKKMTNSSDTLIVVTADHAHTMSISGYPRRSTPIFGIAGTGSDDLPYSLLNYANGAGFKLKEGKRHDIREDDMNKPDYVFPAGVPSNLETHGGDDVAVFADGPWAHLLSGSFEQNFIPHAMAYAACVGKGITSCDEQKTLTPSI